MDKQTLLDICQPFKKINVEGKTFYLRRLSPKHFNELHSKYFNEDEEKTVIDTNMTAEQVQLLSKRLQDKFKMLAEWHLDILTYSLCEEDGTPIFNNIEQDRETVRIFDPVYFGPLKDAAYEFSYGYYHKHCELQRKAEAKKKRSKKTRYSRSSIVGRTPEAKQGKS